MELLRQKKKVRFWCAVDLVNHLEQEKLSGKAELQKHILEWAAFHVAEILAEDVDDGVSAYEETSDDTPTAALNRYLDIMNARKPQDQQDMTELVRLRELAAPLIRKADGGREAGKHVGAFTPKRIEVKNYRSYGSPRMMSVHALRVMASTASE